MADLLRRLLNLPTPQENHVPNLAPLPTEVAAHIAEHRARLAAIAAERLADDPTHPDTDPVAWRQREADRSRLEATTAAAIAQLRQAADNEAARGTRPAPIADRCCGCGRKIPSGHAIEQPDGWCCPTCVQITAAERAELRAFRAIPTDERARYLDGLPSPALSDLFHLANRAAPRTDWALRQVLADAVARRRRRDAASRTKSTRQRRHLAEAARNATRTDTAGETIYTAWAALSDTLNHRLGAVAQTEVPATREVLDTLDDAALREVRRLTARVRDHSGEAVLVAELRRRRTTTTGAPGAGPGAA